MRLLPSNVEQTGLTSRSSFNKVVAVAFHQRRKTIKNNLASIASVEQLRQSLIDPNQRPQEISMQQYITLSNQLAN